MKRVIYAGSEFLTGDDIAIALLSCCRVLAEAGESEMVTIPARERAGSTTTVTVLIGPASQIVVMDAPWSGGELADPATVDRLREIERRLHLSESRVRDGALPHEGLRTGRRRR